MVMNWSRWAEGRGVSGLLVETGSDFSKDDYKNMNTKDSNRSVTKQVSRRLPLFNVLERKGKKNKVQIVQYQIDKHRTTRLT
jgi:hypothetical protein